MIGFEERLRSELEVLVPLPDDAAASWEDALRRASVSSVAAQRRPFRRHHVALVAAVLAAVAALAISPAGAAIARSFGDFSVWLTGSPGTPASEEAQRAFEEGTARSWREFPEGPKLRSLITTQEAGGRFELFGFRSGDELCLRLTVEGIPTDAPPAMGCAPLAELRRAQAPAVTVIVDYAFGRQDVPPNDEGYIPARASASFGVVADGVNRVDLTTTRGQVAAIVASNAFLAVTDNPPLGLRTKKLEAAGAHGKRVSVPLAEAPFGESGAPARPGVAPGPAKVERRIEHGTIGWLARREPRGQSVEEAGVDAILLARGFGTNVLFARVVTPDPQLHVPVLVGIVRYEPGQSPHLPDGEQVCMIVTFGGGCSPLAHLFPPGIPFSVGTMSGYGGSQYVLVEGFASDDVARVELFLADGERMPVPLEDNMYLVEVARLKFPARLVAYDAEGRVIGIEAQVRDPLASYGPRPIPGRQRIVKRVASADGDATLRLGPSTEGTTCFQIRFGDGRTSTGCQPKSHQGPALTLNYDPSGVVHGTVSPRVAKIEVRLKDGKRVQIEPLEGVVLAGLNHQAEPEAAVGYDEAGREVGRQPFPWRPSASGG